jgi:hypothetical protein
VHTLLADHVGYTLYDMVTMYLKPKESASMWLHHIVGVIGAVSMLHYKQGAYFPVVFFITELTVPIVNLIWFTDRFGGTHCAPGSFLRLLLVTIRALCFILFRLAVGPLAFAYALDHHQPLPALVSDVAATASASKWYAFWINFTQLPTVVWTGSLAAMMFLSSLNVHWTYGAVRAVSRDWRRYRQAKNSV